MNHFANATGCGENSRTGAYYNGFFYERDSSGPFFKMDVGTGVVTATGVTPSEGHTATDVDFATGKIYIGPYTTGTVFQSYNVASNNLTGLLPRTLLVSVDTLSEYFSAVHASLSRSRVELPDLTDRQMLPLVTTATDDSKTRFTTLSWSGYYGTRPRDKFLMRAFGLFARGLRSVFALQLARGQTSQAELYPGGADLFGDLEWTAAKMQHHDAITGTSTQEAAASYVQVMKSALRRVSVEAKRLFDKHIFSERPGLMPQIQYLPVSPFNETLYIANGTKTYFLILGQSLKLFRMVRLATEFGQSLAFACNRSQVSTSMPLNHTNASGSLQQWWVSVQIGDGEFDVCTAETRPADPPLPSGFSSAPACMDPKVTLTESGEIVVEVGSVRVAISVWAYLFKSSLEWPLNSPAGKYVFSYTSKEQVPLRRLEAGVQEDGGSLDYRFTADIEILNLALRIDKNASRQVQDASQLQALIALNFDLFNRTSGYTGFFRDSDEDPLMTIDSLTLTARYRIEAGESITQVHSDSNGLTEETFPASAWLDYVADEDVRPVTQFAYMQTRGVRVSLNLDRSTGLVIGKKNRMELFLSRFSLLDDGLGSFDPLLDWDCSVVHRLAVQTLAPRDTKVYRQLQAALSSPFLMLQMSHPAHPAASPAARELAQAPTANGYFDYDRGEVHVHFKRCEGCEGDLQRFIDAYELRGKVEETAPSENYLQEARMSLMNTSN